jgi:hypothetical protein
MCASNSPSTKVTQGDGAALAEPVLKMRLDALSENLNRVSDLNAIRDAFKLGVERFFDDLFWDEVQERLQTQVDDRIFGVKKIRESVDLAEHPRDLATTMAEREKRIAAAWLDYYRLRDDCQGIFLEIHDVIAGLFYRAMRFRADQGFDATLCYAADDLIRFWAVALSATKTLTVPSPQEALALTLGRIVRMRYSEWTVWSLPLVAHEFAHVVLGESKHTSTFAQFFQADLLSRLAALNPECRGALNPEADPQIKQNYYSQAMSRMENEMRYFLADAFGTWTVGPAYAAAAIHLRLNPAYVSTIGTTESFDHERVHVILGVLEKSADSRFVDGAFPTSQYRECVKQLRPVWDGMVARANARGAETRWSEEKIAARRLFLNELIESICTTFFENGQFRSTLYTRSGSTRYIRDRGWPVAARWSFEWTQSIGATESDPLTRIPVTGNSMIRDALNAGWECRQKNPNQLERLTDALRLLCQDICDKRFEVKGGGTIGSMYDPSKEQGHEIGRPSR